MKYLLLLIGDGDVPDWPGLSSDGRLAVVRRVEEFDAACAAREGVASLSGEALPGPSSAATLRNRGGQLTVTEGPYAEAIEGLGGYYRLEAPDLDTVIELLAVLPPYDMQVVPTVEPMA